MNDLQFAKDIVNRSLFYALVSMYIPSMVVYWERMRHSEDWEHPMKSKIKEYVVWKGNTNLHRLFAWIVWKRVKCVCCASTYFSNLDFIARLYTQYTYLWLTHAKLIYCTYAMYDSKRNGTTHRKSY